MEEEIKSRQQEDKRIIAQMDDVCSKLIGEVLQRVGRTEEAAKRGLKVEELLAEQKAELATLKKSIKTGIQAAETKKRRTSREDGKNASFSLARGHSRTVKRKVLSSTKENDAKTKKGATVAEKYSSAESEAKKRITHKVASAAAATITV